MTKIESISRTGLSVVYLDLDENLKETGKELDDIKLKLDGIRDLPDGAGPINFIKDFGDTAALMLTVASPKAGDLEIELRAKAIQPVIERARSQSEVGVFSRGGSVLNQTARNSSPVPPEGGTPNGNSIPVPPEGGAPNGAENRAALIVCLPQSLTESNLQMARKHRDLFVEYLEEQKAISHAQPLEGPGFIGVDAAVSLDDASLLKEAEEIVRERLQAADFHPDAWSLVLIRDPRQTQDRLASVAGDKYSYRELDQFTDLIEKTIKTLPTVSKVSRTGLLDERIFLYYSQERLAAYGVQPSRLQDILSARNITAPGGQLAVEGKNLSIDPTGEFKSEKEIGDVAVAASDNGAPVYLRDLAEVTRGYESPSRFLNYYNWRDAQGNWRRTRAVTLAVQMRSGEQIDRFGQGIDSTLTELKKRLPEDLVMARTSDQPLQVRENLSLFMSSLYEAVILVVIVSLIGFWEWRSAALMALSMPITLLMTFGMMHALGIDLQQVSVASLIIALGLLVDDPVVAGDAIKRQLASGQPSIISAWLGPTKLATAIMYATVTNIVAYLPFLLLKGATSEFIYSLPVVLTCSLVASRLVSMTFIPLLGYYLLRPKAEASIEERRKKGFAAFYYRIGDAAINHRWKVLAGSLVFLALGGIFAGQLKQQFFPKDLSYLSYVDIWLPEESPLTSTNQAAHRAEEVIRDVVQKYGSEVKRRNR